MQRVMVTGGFDDLRFEDFRFLDEAAKFGPLHVLLWSDDAIKSASYAPPKFPQAEREYVVSAIRYVQGIQSLQGNDYGPGDEHGAVPKLGDGTRPAAWVVHELDDSPLKRAWCRTHGLIYHVVRKA